MQLRMITEPQRPLTILNVAYPLAIVGPDSIGGAEQVVSQLDVSLARAGHQSIVVASEGSKVAGTLVPTPRWDGELNKSVQEAAASAHTRAIRTVLERARVDLIHLHGLDFHRYLPACVGPVLATLHLP